MKLMGMGITDISQIEGLENLTSLRVLNLKDNLITEIKGLDTLINLKELNLSGNQITEIKGLDNLSSLFTLNLSSNKISEIKGLDNIGHLVVLDLSSNNISEIKGLEKMNNLSILSLENNKFTDIKGLEYLTHFPKITLGLKRHPKWNVRITGYNLNGHIIPLFLARKMGIKYARGNRIEADTLYINAKKMVKYCQFVKDTGNIDFTTPGLLKTYKEWEKSH